MNRSSRVNERKILTLYFQGHARDAIGRMVGVAPSTVSEVISILPENLTGLRELSVELKKQDLSVLESARGAELRAKLPNLGVDFEKLQSYVEASEKMETNPDYEPKKVIESAMQLSDLEEETGQSYPEIVRDYENKKGRVRKLAAEDTEREERIERLDGIFRQKLRRNRVTQQMIDYIVQLRRDFQAYDIELSDCENLRKYLGNMKETGGNCRLFAEYTKKLGSLNAHMDQLRQKEQEHTLDLQTLQESTREASSKLAELRGQIDEAKNGLATENRRVEQARQTEKTVLARTAVLLEVESTVENVTDALVTKQKELARIELEIPEKKAQRQGLEQQVQELQDRKAFVEKEVQDRLKIKGYATQLQSAVTNLETQKLSLEKENSQKRERLALADTITNFLTKQTTYDFDRLYSNVQLIKKIRESRTYQTSLNLPVSEEETRLLALKAFEGDLASKKDYQTLLNEKENSEKTQREREARIVQLESDLRQSEKNRESTLHEKQFLETVRINFGGRPTTLGEAKNWLVSTYRKEIQKRADEKFKAGAAVTYGALDFVFKKITHRDNTPADGGQQ